VATGCVKILTGKIDILSLCGMNFLNRYTDTVYCIMRLIVGLMLACHGLQLVFGFFGGMPGSDKMITQVGGWIQLVGGFLVAFGLLTRLSAFICSGMMAVAYFMFHVAPAATPTAKLIPIASAGPQFSNHGELAVFYCWVFFFMFFYGPGRWSIDALFKGSARSPSAPLPS
jgi:putative oxidoreductase